MLNLALLIVEVWMFGGLVLWLHKSHPRFGFTPLLFVVSALTVWLHGQLEIYVEPTPGFILFVGSNVLVPVVLMSVLVFYIADGAVSARLMIYCVLGVSALTLAFQALQRLHLAVPNGGSLLGSLVSDLIAPPNPRTTLASLAAFAADMFVIAVFYQGVKNHAPRLPEGFVIGLALLAGLWCDAIVFGFVDQLGTRDLFNSCRPTSRAKQYRLSHYGP